MWWNLIFVRINLYEIYGRNFAQNLEFWDQIYWMFLAYLTKFDRLVTVIRMQVAEILLMIFLYSLNFTGQVLDYFLPISQGGGGGLWIV